MGNVLVLYYNTHIQPFTAFCPGLCRWVGMRRINHSRFYWSTNNGVAVTSAGPYASHCTFLQTGNHANTSSHKFFYGPDALSGTQPTASKHWKYSAVLEMRHLYSDSQTAGDFSFSAVLVCLAILCQLVVVFIFWVSRGLIGIGSVILSHCLYKPAPFSWSVNVLAYHIGCVLVCFCDVDMYLPHFVYIMFISLILWWCRAVFSRPIGET